jgi:hypothetical protein
MTDSDEAVGDAFSDKNPLLAIYKQDNSDQRLAAGQIK